MDKLQQTVKKRRRSLGQQPGKGSSNTNRTNSDFKKLRMRMSEKQKRTRKLKKSQQIMLVNRTGPARNLIRKHLEPGSTLSNFTRSMGFPVALAPN